jgi:hypothetical protein
MVPIRSRTGWTPLPRRPCVVSGWTAFLKATITCGSSVAGNASSSCQGISGRPVYTPRLLATANLRTPQQRGRVQCVEQAGRVRTEVADRVLTGEAAGEVDDVADVVTIGEGEEGVAVGDVEGFHGDPAGEERRDLGPAVGGDADLPSEVEDRAGGVRADHAQPAGDEDHRTTW